MPSLPSVGHCSFEFSRPSTRARWPRRRRAIRARRSTGGTTSGRSTRPRETSSTTCSRGTRGVSRADARRAPQGIASTLGASVPALARPAHVATTTTSRPRSTRPSRRSREAGLSRGLRIEWRSAALDRNSGLSWRAKLAGAVYCEFANADGVHDPAPSAPTLAAYMGVTLTTAHEARRELEQAGWLTVIRRRGRPSRMEAHVARTPAPQGGVEEPTLARTPAPTPARTPAPGAPEPDNQITREPGRAPSPAPSRRRA